MFQSYINDDTCGYIIENTITECNRVLNNWKLNEKKIGYNDKISLFRSYLAEFFKQRYGWQTYNRCIRLYEPLVIIEDYKVIGIDFNLNKSNGSPNIYLDALDKYVKRINVLKFSELQELPTYSTTKVEGLVDYKKLCNIRFN